MFLFVGACTTHLERYSSTRFLSAVNQTIDTNGATKIVQANATMRKSTNSLYSHQLNNLTTLPLSGNLHHPAERSQYFLNIQRNLLMATVRPI